MIPGFVNAAQLEHWRVSVDGAIERGSQFPLATQADNTNDTTVSSVHTHHNQTFWYVPLKNRQFSVGVTFHWNLYGIFFRAWVVAFRVACWVIFYGN